MKVEQTAGEHVRAGWWSKWEMIEWTGLEDGEGCVVEGERGTKKDSGVSAARIKGRGWCHFLGLVQTVIGLKDYVTGFKACSVVGRLVILSTVHQAV